MTPERFQRLRATLERRQPDLTVLLERVNKSHNFSAILRNCDAVGVLEAHMVPPDGKLPVHLRTSAGTSQWVPVQRHDSTADALACLKAAGLRVVAAHPAEGAMDYREYDYTRPTAIMMGAELHGVSDEGLAAADAHVVVPMEGLVRSLNVSVAAALLLFEARRQRESAGYYATRRISDQVFESRLFEWAFPREARLLSAEGRPYPVLDEAGQWHQTEPSSPSGA